MDKYHAKNKIIVQESKRKCPCCPFCSLFFLFMKSDFTSHNQIYQLLYNESLETNRSLRLLFFFLPLYIEIALCAFFFDLEGG